jgi:hypothetical protein
MTSACLVYLALKLNRRAFIFAVFVRSVYIELWFRLRLGSRALFPDLYSEIPAAQKVRTRGLTAGLVDNRFEDALGIRAFPLVIGEMLGANAMSVSLCVFPIALTRHFPTYELTSYVSKLYADILGRNRSSAPGALQ